MNVSKWKVAATIFAATLASTLLAQIPAAAPAPTKAPTPSAAQPALGTPSVSERKIVTIGEFKNKSIGASGHFETLIDRITNAIVNTRKFEVVDQARLKEALSQHALADAGISNAADAPQKGKIKSAGFIIYGTVLTLGETGASVRGDGYSANKATAEVELNIRFTEVETGQILASKIVKAHASKSIMAGNGMHVASNINTAAIQEAIDEAAKKVTEALMELAFPTKIIAIGDSDFTINLTQERAKLGQPLKIFALGAPLVDPDTNESLGNEEKFICEAQVSQVAVKYAKAVPLGGASLQSLSAGMLARPLSDEEIAARTEAAKAQSLKQFKDRF